MQLDTRKPERGDRLHLLLQVGTRKIDHAEAGQTVLRRNARTQRAVRLLVPRAEKAREGGEGDRFFDAAVVHHAQQRVDGAVLPHGAREDVGVVCKNAHKSALLFKSLSAVGRRLCAGRSAAGLRPT